VGADPDKPAELVGIIRSLMADVTKLRAMEEAARNAAPSYDRAAELQKYLEVFDHLTAG
jgi:hypothetical protein